MAYVTEGILCKIKKKLFLIKIKYSNICVNNNNNETRILIKYKITSQ